jgi:hypothetical protein
LFPSTDKIVNKVRGNIQNPRQKLRIFI